MLFCALVVSPFQTLKAPSSCFCHRLIGSFPFFFFFFSKCAVVFHLCPTESGVLQSPVFTKQPGSIVYPVETVENREVVFSCEAQGSPPPVYRWVCGSLAPPFTRRARLPAAAIFHSATYHCRMSPPGPKDPPLHAGKLECKDKRLVWSLES